jgi:DNA-binding SARP family transcriptional activator/tetratricopeptide (TPR) repeat protein
MEFRLFGEVELRAAGESLEVGTPRQQAVLAALVVDAGRPVATQTIVDRVWDDAPPAEARNVLYSHLSRIRQLLGQAAELTGATAVRIERRHAGYVLQVDPDLVDLHRFRRLVEQAHDPRSADSDRAARLAQALALWRGAPLAGIPGQWAEHIRDSWHRRRLDALVQWGEVELRLGNPTAVIATLPDLVVEHPLVEPLEALLIRALHAAGREAEAIDRYTAVRQRLADELGVDPGAELRELYQAILRGDLPPAPPLPPAPVVEQPLAKVKTLLAPAQLPPDVNGFAGRDDEVRQLDDLLTGAGDRPTAVPIAVVTGTAGVGKTALAVHWAHRVRDEFRDGQLYVNLQGFDPAGSPVTPAKAVQGFLEAFEVPPERLRVGFEAQVGLYRSLLANRRVLVVLDNARDAEQVRPLLPGARGCLAVVTSRNQLGGLVAASGAKPLVLGLPTAAEARDLLANRLGTRRIAAEPDAVDAIITSCARLPLALAIVAARAAMHPSFSLGALASELRESGTSLDRFVGDDPATDPRAVFSWSYLQLTPEAARLFRLLGLHPGPDVGTAAAASLAGVPVNQVRPLLAELAQAHLVNEHRPGRYTFHDLLRAYAAEQVHALGTEVEQVAAVRRLLGYYVHTANSADRLLDPNRDEPPPLAPLADGASRQRFADHGHALAWFDAERPVLLAVIRQVAGFDTEIWHLAWLLRRFFDYQGHWHDSIESLSAALDAARRLADPRGQAFAHCFLSCAYIRFGRYEDTLAHLEHAQELYQSVGDLVGEGYVHHYHAWMLDRQDRPQEALAHAERAYDLWRTAGYRPGQAKALNAIGWFHALLGRHVDALGYCQQALDLQTELDAPLGQAETWDSLGYAHHHLGDHTRAIECYQAAVALYRAFDYRYNEADAMASLGDVHYSAGNLESAGEAWRRALHVLDQLGHTDADAVRTKLERMDRPAH